MEFGKYISLTKVILGDNCHGWSLAILSMVAHHPKDDHPPEGGVLQTWNLGLKLYSQN